jgi:peroxiredoxin
MATKKSNKSLWVMLALIAAIIAVILLLPSCGNRNAKKGAETDAESTTLVKAGDTAPDFTVEMVDGSSVTLGDLKGKVVLLNFWATWCPPCRQELTRVQTDIIDRFAGKEFVFLPVSRGEKREAVEAFREKTGYDITGRSEEELREACKQLNVEVDETFGKGKLIDAIFGQYCEEELIQPTFITDYPREMSPLCKRHRSNPDLTERFELFVNGKELCNAYSELNDPIDQLERFQEQLRLSEKGDDEAMFIDMDFVRALEYGMPTCSGMGIGIDRLTMFMTDQSSIQDVLFFPQMRPEKKVVNDPAEAYTAIGVPEEWVPVIQKMGYLTVESLRKLAPGKFFNDLCGFNKKNKLGLKAPSIDEVKAWLN